MGVKSIPCPENCIKDDKPGMMREIIPDSKRYFCETPNCKLAFIDEKGDRHYMGIGNFSQIPIVEEPQILINS
ncbi:MAG: hypothetical protein KGI08_08190 [Thaumarchaeota archaeon]|nr:hypothetical protein [Nitrososphaerota archaeon]